MKVTIPDTLGAAASAPAAAPARRSRVAVLLAATVVLAIGGQLLGLPTAAASDGLAQNFRAGQGVEHFRVGHRVEAMTVSGSAKGEPRSVDVHLWYPAGAKGFSEAPKTVYTSALYGRPLTLGGNPLLSWSVPAEVARENVAIDPSGPPFPVIVFSHGSTNDPIDYAHTLELIASEGFVVAAPYHVNNTQDDVRIDYVIQTLKGGLPLWHCNDGRLPPCSRTDVAFSMADRVNDISAVLDRLPGWLGDRVDVSRAGVLGHSRGTVTALAAAGGSVAWSPDLNCQAAPHGPLCWPLAPDPRVKAVMGLAIGASKITFGANLAKVSVPTLLVAGGNDKTSPQEISKMAFNAISSTEKAFVLIPNAVHRSYDSTYCDQAQAAGAVADTNHDGQIDPQELAAWMTNASLDRQTLAGIVTAQTSGTAMDYCPFSTFTTPTDIRPLIKALSGFDVTPDNVPTAGLTTDEVKQEVTELAVTFFGTVLKSEGNAGPHSTGYLAAKWLEKH
jgi:predicted dienelactone hydrolase